MAKNIEKLALIMKYEVDNNIGIPEKTQAFWDQYYLNVWHHCGTITLDQYFEGMCLLMGTKPKTLDQVKKIVGI